MLCGVVAVTVSACDPGGIGSASVAYTTDRTVTRELDRQNVEVRWLSCTATAQNTNPQHTNPQHTNPRSTAHTGTTSNGTGVRAPAGERAAASVDCRGRTGDGRDITASGRVTRVVDGVCVRGDLSVEVGGERWFRGAGLGDCDATPGPVAPPTPLTSLAPLTPLVPRTAPAPHVPPAGHLPAPPPPPLTRTLPPRPTSPPGYTSAYTLTPRPAHAPAPAPA
ncbi:hypothetical protein, partial [Streptomyces sp. AD55]|uniref:hypothetical protein n=1 Tax=Streptomyces sp. AD55 TaxID=3242895 RepID=UPI0035290151